jgi:hypothetical protein
VKPGSTGSSHRPESSGARLTRLDPLAKWTCRSVQPWQETQ